MGFFISYLTLVFSKHNSTKTFDKENQLEKEAMQRKYVPNLVYMQNLKILSNYIQLKMQEKE